MYSPVYYEKEKRNYFPKKLFFRNLFLLLLILIPSYPFFTFSLVKLYESNIIVTPLAREFVKKTIILLRLDVNSKNIEEIVQKNIKDQNGDYAIAIKNLKTGERYYFNEHEQFKTASLYKLWIMGETFNQIKNGKLTENTTMSANLADLRTRYKVSSDSAKPTSDNENPTVSWPVLNAIELMITVSDNDSALLLSDKIRLANVKKFIEDYNFTESNLGTSSPFPVSTALDMMHFFEKLYKGEIVDKEYSDRMIELLKKQKRNNKIPKNLADVVIAHKTGELEDFSHDAGIVYTPKGNFLIVLLTKTNNPPNADNIISKISEEVYEYFIR